MKKSVICCLLSLSMLQLMACAVQENEAKEQQQSYYFPAEDEAHEGTWLTWPHHYTYGKT